jgi:hypothetical protein
MHIGHHGCTDEPESGPLGAKSEGVDNDNQSFMQELFYARYSSPPRVVLKRYLKCAIIFVLMMQERDENVSSVGQSAILSPAKQL